MIINNKNERNKGKKDKKLMDKNGLDATKQLWESREQKNQRKKMNYYYVVV